jgi:hypothetical protein
MGESFYYEILIKGRLDECWQDWFHGLRMENQDDGQVLLSGFLPDQTALHGAFAKIRDLNLIVISVQLSAPL